MSSFKSIARHIHKYAEIQNVLHSDSNMDFLFDVVANMESARQALYKKLYRGIGNTSIKKINLSNGNVLHLKLECENTMGNSHYARYWLPYLFIAEALGLIEPDKTHLLEVTSGSAGIALSEAAQVLGYNLTMIVPEILPDSRISPMLANGTTVVRVPGYIDQCINRLAELNEHGTYFLTNHSEERANLIIDTFRRIAIEYLHNHEQPDFAIIGLGNGASTEAVFSEFEENCKKTKRICFHPSLDDYHTVFGLFGPNVELRHVNTAKSLSHDIIEVGPLWLENLKESELVNKYHSLYGDSTVIAIGICEEMAKNEADKTFFSIAYDKRERYAE